MLCSLVFPNTFMHKQLIRRVTVWDIRLLCFYETLETLTELAGSALSLYQSRGHSRNLNTINALPNWDTAQRDDKIIAQCTWNAKSCVLLFRLKSNVVYELILCFVKFFLKCKQAWLQQYWQERQFCVSYLWLLFATDRITNKSKYNIFIGWEWLLCPVSGC